MKISVKMLEDKNLCEKIKNFQDWKLDTRSPQSKAKDAALEKVFRSWSNGEISMERIETDVMSAYTPDVFEDSEVLAAEHANTLILQLWRMGKYILEKGYTVEPGFFYEGPLGTDDFRMHSSMVLKSVDETIEVIVKEKTELSKKARKPENKPEGSILLNALAYHSAASTVAVWTLAHKDDKSDVFMPDFDVAEGKKGLLTGKQIVELSVGDKSMHFMVLSERHEEAKGCSDCTNCFYADVCKTLYTAKDFRKAEVELGGDETADKKYTSRQQEVINFREGNLAVLAGPGSGKTGTLTKRYCSMIDDGIPASQILLVTFSNKAAAELRSRITKAAKLDDFKASQLNVFTLNAIGQKIINDNPTHFGKVSVASSVEVKGVIRDVLYPEKKDDLSLQTLRHKFRKIYAENYGINRLAHLVEQLRELGTDGFESVYPTEPLDELKTLTELVDRKMATLGIITYDEQISRVVEYLATAERVRKMYQYQYRYIMVDESQDLDCLQWEFVKLLSSGNLVMVGDDDQSIYQFRKGDPKFLIAFSREKDTKTVVLDRNFRSGKQVVGLSSDLLKLAEYDRIAKDVQSENVASFVYVTDDNEPEDLARLIKERLSCGIAPGDIAVLCRRNNLLESLEAVLSDEGIMAAAPKDYLRTDPLFYFAKDSLALHLFRNDEPDKAKVALLRIANLLSIPLPTDKPLESLVNEPAMAQHLDDLDRLMKREAVEIALEQMLRKVTGECKAFYPALNVMKDLAEVKAWTPRKMYEFLSQMEVMCDDTRVGYEADKERVQLLTAHDSKGKEFDTVFIFDGDKYEESEENLRLLYVAITRAKTHLYLMFSDLSSKIATNLALNPNTNLMEGGKTA